MKGESVKARARMKRNSVNENEKEQKENSTFEYDENQFIFNECRQRPEQQ